jgi:peptidyl-prolyl cis-trans isomerase SurA
MRRSVLTQTWLRITLSLTIVAFLQTAHAQTRELATRGELLDRVAAIVNDGVVLSSELDEQVAIVGERIKEQKLELPPQNVLRQQVLERLVLQEIQMQRANKAGLKVSDDNLNAALLDVAQRNKLTLAQLPQALSRQGIDYTAYRDDIRKELTLGLLRQRDVLQRIAITPREVDQFLDKQAKTPNEKNEYNVSHILIAVPQEASPALVEQASKKAQEVYQRAKGGEDFGKLALAFSNSQTALEGGALGWRKGSELPTFLTDTVVHLKAGEVSEPLRTPTGFHLAKLNGVRSTDAAGGMEDQVHVRHILMKTTELADDATVRQKLAAMRERVLKGEDFAGLASTTSADPGSANQGGDLGWSGPGSFVPEFEAEVAKLKDNEISEPFRTQYGWHIVQVLGHRRIDNSSELRRRQAIDAIRNSKADEETELWLRRLRDESYVDYKL